MYMYVHVRMRMHMFWGERVPLLEQTLNRDGSLPDDDRTRQAEPASPGPDPALILLTTPGSHSALILLTTPGPHVDLSWQDTRANGLLRD